MTSQADKEKYDSLYLSVLQQEGSLPGLFDSLFSFLMRRTDFYHLLSDSERGDRGFREGVAMEMVVQSFRKHETIARRALQRQPPNSQQQQQQQQQPPKQQPQAKQPKPQHQQQLPPPSSSSTLVDPATGEIAYSADSECYNGAVCEGYAWSQSIGELDLRVSVDPNLARKGSDVRVSIARRSVRVECRRGDGSGQFDAVLERQFCHDVRPDEAVWSLVPSDAVVQVSLEKHQERWWDACFVGEAKINTRQIDCSRPMSELDEEAQAKIGQMMYDQRQKQLGLPTSEEAKNLEVLRRAWDAEGSPFKGTPFDPSVLSASSGGGSGGQQLPHQQME